MFRSLLKYETKKELGSYLLDVSKFIVAGAIIDRVFNGSNEIKTSIVFASACLFLVLGLWVVNVINKGGNNG